MLFDNSLNDKRFRIDIRTENGYEEGCTRGATVKPRPSPGLRCLSCISNSLLNKYMTILRFFRAAFSLQ